MNNITNEELSMLEACQSAKDWGQACDTIKKARGGDYPEDWWEKVKLSGMMDRIFSRWGGSGDLKLTTHDSFSDLRKHLNDCWDNSWDGRVTI